MSFVPPSEDEVAAVVRLKEKLEVEKPEGLDRYQFTDTGILRFYRGRKQDEEKAYRALIKHLEWRKENNVDDINNQTNLFEKEVNSGKFNINAVDKEGRPSIFIYARKHDKNDRDIDEMKLVIIHTLENILKKTKPEEERINICFDLTGFTYNCMDYDVVKLLVNILQFNYPDTLSVALVINSPFLFSACWAIIRPWLDPVTAAKVGFVKKDDLKNYFEPEMIPLDN